MKGFLCKQTPVNTISLTTSEINLLSPECGDEPGGDSPRSSHSERKLPRSIPAPGPMRFNSLDEKRPPESSCNIRLVNVAYKLAGLPLPV